MLSSLANLSRRQIYSLDWPLAPENRFPVARDVVLEALALLPPGRFQLAGDSAGGNLAISVARTLPAGLRSRLDRLVLIHPMLDATLRSPSTTAFREGYGLTRDAMHWAWQQYLAEGTPPDSSAVSPVFAQPDELTGLPATLIVVADLDPARDDGLRFASRLRSANVAVSVARYPGVVHNFTLMAGLVDSGRAALEQIARFLT
jgi:acetyl esterase